MSAFESKTNATVAVASFDDMIKQFGVVTVMNAKVFLTPWEDIRKGIAGSSTTIGYKAHDVMLYLDAHGKDIDDENAQLNDDDLPYVAIDSLKIANINMEGPTKTVTGGQYANPLIKFGKTATIEMQDALGHANILAALGGALVEDYNIEAGINTVLHFGQDFSGSKTILGDSFFIDRKTGAQVKVRVLIYQMLPDSVFNLTQDAEGDATVFDLNGSLLATDILVGDETMGTDGITRGIFYSILPVVNYNITRRTVDFALATALAGDAAAAAYVATFAPISVVDGSDCTLPVLNENFKWCAVATGGDAIIVLEDVSADTTVYMAAV